MRGVQGDMRESYVGEDRAAAPRLIESRMVYVDEEPAIVGPASTERTLRVKEGVRKGKGREGGKG